MSEPDTTDYLGELQRSMAESRAARAGKAPAFAEPGPLPSRLAGPTAPNIAGYQGTPGGANQEPIMLGAVGGGGIFQIDTPPVSAPGSPSSGGSAVVTPFQPLAAMNVHTDSLFWLRINPFSYVSSKPQPDSSVSVTGLNSDFSVSNGDRIWLHATIAADGTISAGALEHGASWTGYPNTATFNGSGTYADPFVQTAAYLQVGYVVMSGSGLPPGLDITRGTVTLRAIQQVANHQLVVPSIVYGTEAVEFAPYGAPQV